MDFHGRAVSFREGKFNSSLSTSNPRHDLLESSFIFLAAAVRRTSSLSKMPSARVSGEVRVKFPLKALGDVEGGWAPR